MTAPTTADARVASWPSITREAGTIYQLQSGGYLVEVGGDYPVFHADEDDARRFLRALGFPAGGPVRNFGS
ncbi:hypothetical protein FHR83_006627 [Actinoplanes campanulatus]|uniref:Uncharacterized protein n=1 Tax=Actinoplanes campanulatus TaxID=113559 RepID=A0A7W5FHS3_9ACTN|nr:hypothetical protein [Actinoplanes campanulatus]MBB3098921.1 hypothetical protein [Actinoplanes campanulatus]GGN39841.1 hypothetical protein GCM10010109_68290 [Actinoplanes campanulatus]GID40125.1 hypothetical protein Aca09nite_66310 [Actinoplanes campanulatus]